MFYFVLFHFFNPMLSSETAYPYLSHNWQDLQLFLQSLKNFLCPKDMQRGTGISAFSAMYLIPTILTLLRNALSLSSICKKIAHDY